MRLLPRVRDELARHGIEARSEETPEQLRERLNDRYLEEVRELRERRRRGELPGAEFARAVALLRDRYPLLGMPAGMWGEVTPRSP